MVDILRLSQYVINHTPRALSHLELQRVLFLIRLDYNLKNKKDTCEETIVKQIGVIYEPVYDKFLKRYNLDLPKTGENIALPNDLRLSVNRVFYILRNKTFWNWYNFGSLENIAEILKDNDLLHEKKHILSKRELRFLVKEYRKRFW